MKNCLTAVVLLLLCTVTLSAQKLKHIIESNTTLKNEASILFFNSSANFKNTNSSSVVTIKNFPVTDSQASSVKLKSIKSIIDSSTLITVGNNVRIKLPVMKRFIGKIDGDSKSEVFVTLIDNAMYCKVKHGNGEEYTIAPSNEKLTEYTVTNSRINVSKEPVSCSSVEPTNWKNVTKEKGSKVLSSSTLQVDIALDACKEWFLYKFPNDTVKVRDYILSLYSMVSYLYEKEMNITIHVPYFHIWTSTDPYDTETTWSDYGVNPGTILSNMPEYWKKNNLNVKANLVHAITVGKVGGGGGVGNYNGLASGIHDGNKYGPFAGISVTAWSKSFNVQPVLNFDFDVHTIAHEMGHNFNCPHTHSCSWNPPIDTCVVYDGSNDGCQASGSKRICTQYTETSIMSYCREINNWVSKMTFLSKPAELIRNYAEKYLKEVVTDVAKPQSPSLVFPMESIENVPLESIGFKWLKNDITLNYRFQLSQSELFDSLYKDTTIVYDTVVINGLEEATKYYWRVAAINNSGEGEFSEVRQFKTLNTIDFLQPEAVTNLESDVLEFGDVKMGTTKEMTFNVITGNVVNLPLDSITFFGESGSFAIKSISKNLPTILTKDDSSHVIVAFTPTKNDVDVSASVKISYHDKEAKYQVKFIDVSGNVILPSVNIKNESGEYNSILSVQPNPLINIGIVKYFQNATKEVKLSVYNTLGQEVIVLFNGLSEAGEHTMPINIDVLPTGMYQFVLSVNSLTVTHPITVIK